MEPTLSRISETMPMISRSDGRSFHLLLADRPVPYPAEKDTGLAERLSLCFWYSCIGRKSPTQSTVVLRPARQLSARNPLLIPAAPAGYEVADSGVIHLHLTFSV